MCPPENIHVGGHVYGHGAALGRAHRPSPTVNTLLADNHFLRLKVGLFRMVTKKKRRQMSQLTVCLRFPINLLRASILPLLLESHPRLVSDRQALPDAPLCQDKGRR